MNTYKTISKMLTVSLLVLAISTGQIYAAAAMPDAIQANTDVQAETHFPVRKIVFFGGPIINKEQLDQEVLQYAGLNKSAADIVKITAAAQKFYAQDGYMVKIEKPKDIGLDGIARFSVVPLMIQKITMSGNKYFTETQIRAALPELKTGSSPNLKKLARQLYLANENPARQVILNFSEDRNGAIQCKIDVNDKKTLLQGITVDNTGTKQSKESRMTYLYFDAAFNERGDFFAFSIGSSPEKTSGVLQTGFFYQIPLLNSGDKLMINASYSNVDSGRVAEAFNVNGEGTSFGVALSHPTKQTLSSKESIDFGFNWHHYKNVVDWGGLDLGPDVDSLPLTLTYNFQQQIQGEAWSIDVQYGHNLPTGGLNGAEQYELSRTGARVGFDFWRLNAGYQKTYNNKWMLTLVFAGQYSDCALISGEQWALGGMYTVRGFGEREFSADKGFRATAEVYSPYIDRSKKQRLLAFADLGYLIRNNVQAFEDKSTTLLGAGIGWRLYIKDSWAARIDLAWPLLKPTGSMTVSGLKAHVAVTKYF